MKFLFPLFAASAAASALGTRVLEYPPTLVERDAASISSAIASISSALATLQTEVEGFGGSGDVDTLTSDSKAVLTAINSGDSAAKSTDQLSQDDALALATPIQALGKQVNSTIDALISKKQAIVSAGAGGLVYSQLSSQRDATATFSKDLTSKVPSALAGTASSLAQPIQDSLNQGVMNFQDQAGSGSSGSGSATATGMSSATGMASGSGSASATATGMMSSAAPSSSAMATDTASMSMPASSGAAGSASATDSGMASGSSAPSPTQSIATAAAGPTAVAGYGAAMVAALAAVAAL
ncbi:hypothetical protein MMC10_009719 [Thelotrema lepadinum]|nr:hypothetical protein [Thelotrema lepadinum]